MNETSLKVEKLAVALFAYNEEGNLLRLLRRIQSKLEQFKPDLRVQYAICIQGNQSTLDEVEQFKKEVIEKSAVQISYSSIPLGVRGAAVQALSLVKDNPDAYLMMDCDLNHQPEEIESFFEKLQPNTVVVGSRYCKGGKIFHMPLWKRILSEGFNRILSLFLRLPVIDKTSGYRLIAGKNVPQIAQSVQSEKFDFYIEFLMRLWYSGFTIVEVPISFTVRTVGKSKMYIGETLFHYCLLFFRFIRGVKFLKTKIKSDLGLQSKKSSRKNSTEINIT